MAVHCLFLVIKNHYQTSWKTVDNPDLLREYSPRGTELEFIDKGIPKAAEETRAQTMCRAES